MNLPYAVFRIFHRIDIPFGLESAEVIIKGAEKARKQGDFTSKDIQSIRASLQRLLRKLEGDRRVLEWRISNLGNLPPEESTKRRLRGAYQNSLQSTQETLALLEAIAPGSRERSAKRRKTAVLATLNDIIPS